MPFNHLPYQSYAGLGETKNKNEHRRIPFPLPRGPILCGHNGVKSLRSGQANPDRENTGALLLLAGGEQMGSEQQPGGGRLPLGRCKCRCRVQGWLQQTGMGGGAEASRLGKPEGGEPTNGPLTLQGVYPVPRHLPALGRSAVFPLDTSILRAGS